MTNLSFPVPIDVGGVHDSNEIAPSELASFLKSGPIRGMLDRLVKRAAHATQVEFVTLGLSCEHRFYFISTYGFPFDSHPESVPANIFKPSMFAAPVEVMDVNNDVLLQSMNTVPLSKTWRYGASVPVRFSSPLTVYGVIALSVADQKIRKLAGSTLVELSAIAEQMTDVIWLGLQARNATSNPHKSAAAMRVLVDSLHQTVAPIALVDANMEILEFSSGLSALQETMLGTATVQGQHLAKTWLDAASRSAVRLAIKSGKTLSAVTSYPTGSYQPITFDFHNLTFPETSLRVGVFSIHSSSLREFPRGVRDNVADNCRTTLPRGESPAILGQFLFETLLPKTRLLQRKGSNYLAVRSWRKSVKTYQIAALKALKTDLTDNVIDRIASEMAASAHAVHGDLKGAKVVPVPCGHSGPGCLSERVAKALASKIGTEMVRAFDCLDVAGSSHPKTNAKRPAMKLLDAPQGRVILVDDVATSGSHIEEARRLLSKSASSVWPIVWIAD